MKSLIFAVFDAVARQVNCKVFTMRVLKSFFGKETESDSVFANARPGRGKLASEEASSIRERE